MNFLKNYKSSHKFLQKITYIIQGVYITKKINPGLGSTKKYFKNSQANQMSIFHHAQ